jgi:hypothetical protein
MRRNTGRGTEKQWEQGKRNEKMGGMLRRNAVR